MIDEKDLQIQFIQSQILQRARPRTTFAQTREVNFLRCTAVLFYRLASSTKRQG